MEKPVRPPNRNTDGTPMGHEYDTYNAVGVWLKAIIIAGLLAAVLIFIFLR